ncbi:MAG: hypothetical protein ABIT08_00825 [Bacteroidia bacterium]
MKEANNDPVNLWTGHMDAVINWGDNVQGPEGADQLRVIFTASQIAGNGDAGVVEGLEVMRFTTLARTGIGNFAAANGSGIPPARRLEIYDEHVLNANFAPATHYNPAPQLRLTHTPDANPANGIWTDFQTTPSGDLYIHPSSAQRDRFVGINRFNPRNTLEINSNILFGNGSREPAGLRFTNLKVDLTAATSLIYPNPFLTIGSNIPAVLSVDRNGDVILVRDEQGSGTLTVCNPPNGPVTDLLNSIPKFSAPGSPPQMCNSQIYDDGTNVSIGYPVTVICNPYPCAPYKLSVDGDIAMTKIGSIFKENSSSPTVYDRIFTCDGGPGGANSNTAGGVGAGVASFSASYDENVYYGYFAGSSDAGSSGNSFIGAEAGKSFVSPGDNGNTFIGFRSALIMTSGKNNFIAGANSGVDVAGGGGLGSGDDNVIIGNQAAFSATGSALNTSICLGTSSGLGITAGDDNIMIGKQTGTTVSGIAKNRGAFGVGANSDCDDCIGLGNNSQRIGMGTYNPDNDARLTVNAGSYTDAAHFIDDIHVGDISGGIGNAYFHNEVFDGTV